VEIHLKTENIFRQSHQSHRQSSIVESSIHKSFNTSLILYTLQSELLEFILISNKLSTLLIYHNSVRINISEEVYLLFVRNTFF
jgi:hypothetical protein